MSAPVQTPAPTVKVADGKPQPAVLERLAQIAALPPVEARRRLEFMALAETCSNFEPVDAAAMLGAFDELTRANVELAQAVDAAKARADQLVERIAAAWNAVPVNLTNSANDLTVAVRDMAARLRGGKVYATKIVDGIFDEFNDRRGYHLNTLEPDLQREIRESLVAMVLRVLLVEGRITP